MNFNLSITARRKHKIPKLQIQKMFRENMKIIKIFSNNCNICRDYSSNDMIATKCGHLFCAECLEKWFLTLFMNGTHFQNCPTCQTNLRKSNERKIELKCELKNIKRELKLIQSKHRRIKRKLVRQQLKWKEKKKKSFLLRK